MSNVSPTTPDGIVSMMLDFIRDMDEAEVKARDAYKMERDYQRDYTEAYAAAWRKVEGPNREYREAIVDDEVRGIRYELDRAKAESKLAHQRQLNVRQALSALQSAARTVGEEAAFSRTGPNLESEVRSF